MGAAPQTFPLLGLRRGIGVFGRERRSAHRGDGYELVSSRPYQPGDNMRAIDWAASARYSSARDSDEFVVREHFAEESPRVVVFVDHRPAMQLYPPELPWLQKPVAVQVAGRRSTKTTTRGLSSAKCSRTTNSSESRALENRADAAQSIARMLSPGWYGRELTSS